jgi:hypothetical protein
MKIHLLISLLCFGFSGALYAHELPPNHPKETMSDTELEAVTDHDHNKEEVPHAHGDQESLLNNVRLNTDQRSVAITRTIAPPSQPIQSPVNLPQR